MTPGETTPTIPEGDLANEPIGWATAILNIFSTDPRASDLRTTFRGHDARNPRRWRRGGSRIACPNSGSRHGKPKKARLAAASKDKAPLPLKSFSHQLLVSTEKETYTAAQQPSGVKANICEASDIKIWHEENEYRDTKRTALYVSYMGF